MIPTRAVLAICVELGLGLLLVVGWQTRIAAAYSGIILIAFGLAMTAALGLEAPLGFSVFSAAGGSLFPAICASFPYSVDESRGRAAPLSEAVGDPPEVVSDGATRWGSMRCSTRWWPSSGGGVG